VYLKRQTFRPTFGVQFNIFLVFAGVKVKKPNNEGVFQNEYIPLPTRHLDITNRPPLQGLSE
jgi:hypothetical protein